MKIRRPNERGLASRENWPSYLGGMLMEVGFILGLTAIALLMAAVAKAVF